MAGNPRIDELRKKLDKEPGSRLFAQLAEELRKDGDLEDAINVAREGLQRHPNYPSARMTLGRALFDTGDWAAARSEFEQVIKGAPDNILASRLLAESLENLGEVEAAVARYKKTLALAPGDKQALAHLEALEKGGGAAAAPPPSVPAPPRMSAAAPRGAAPRPPSAAASAGPSTGSSAGVSAPAAEPFAPIKVVEVDTPMELESSHERPTAPPAPRPPAPAASGPAAAETGEDKEPAPIPLVAAEEDFELERAYEPPSAAAATASAGPASASPPEARGETVSSPPPAPSGGAPAAEPAMMEFEFDGGGVATTMPFAPAPAVSPAAPSPAEPERVSEPVVEPEKESEPVVQPELEAAAAPEAAPSAPEASAATAVAPTEEAPAPAPAAPALPVERPQPTQAAAPPAPSEAAPSAAGAPAAELVSPTLAELYFKQGFTDKAVDVYRQLLEQEPDNERLRRRLAELQEPTPPAPAAAPPAAATPAPAPAAPTPPVSVAEASPAGDEVASRRQALERTIARLESMLAAIKKEGS